MADIRLIIFDFDGVIVESVDAKTWAFAELFKHEEEYLADIIRYHKVNGGISRMVKIKHIYAQILGRPLSNELFEQLCQEYAVLVVERVKACPFVAGAVDFLNSYKEDYGFYIVSGTPHEEIQTIVKERNLDVFFRGIYGSPQIKGAWVKKILVDSGLKANQVIVVGDAIADYEAAKENKTYFIARVVSLQEDVFKGIEGLIKIGDLTQLGNAVSFIKDNN